MTVFVAPRVGAWIEIVTYTKALPVQVVSLPAWERGLK